MPFGPCSGALCSAASLGVLICAMHSNIGMNNTAEVNATIASTTEQASTNLPSNPSNPSSLPRSPISGGAIAGITLGSFGFLAALLTAICLWWRRRRRRRTVRSINCKSISPLSPCSPLRNIARTETVKSEADRKADLGLASAMPELLSASRNNGRGNGESTGRRSLGGVLANARKLTPPRRPPNPQSSNLSFYLVESSRIARARTPIPTPQVKLTPTPMPNLATHTHIRSHNQSPLPLPMSPLSNRPSPNPRMRVHAIRGMREVERRAHSSGSKVPSNSSRLAFPQLLRRLFNPSGCTPAVVVVVLVETIVIETEQMWTQLAMAEEGEKEEEGGSRDLY